MITKGKIEIADGSKIAYRITGDHTKPPILFVNGSVFNYKQYDAVLFPALRKAVKDKFHFIHYDYVGFGESSPLNGDIEFTEIKRQHLEFMDALSIDAAHHFGYSKGSIISFFTTSSNPERVLSVAGYGNPNLAAKSQEITREQFTIRVQYLKGISGIWEQEINKKNYKIVYDTVLLPTIFKDKTVSNLSLKERILNWWIRNKLQPMLEGTLIENIVKLYRYYEKETDEEEKIRYVTAMKNIKTPTLLMHGIEDEIVPIEASKLLSDWIETSKLVEFPFTHTSPALSRTQGKKIMKTYAEFLENA